METAQGAIMKHITEAPEDDMPASPDEASMAIDQAKFIQYVGEEIEDYIEEGNEFPEWMQNKLSGLHEKAKDMHAVMAGKYEGVQESLRKDIASLASQFPKGTKVKVKNARKYDALQKDGVKGEVLGNGKDFIIVAVGKGQMNVHPKDLVKESLDEATMYFVKMRDGYSVGEESVVEEVELDEAIKLNTKVKIHAPGKSYHDKVGHVGEIRHGAYKGAPKTYTVDYDGKSIQLPKQNVKLHKEEVEGVTEATMYMVKMRDGTKHKKTMDSSTAEKMKKNPKVLSVSVIGNVAEESVYVNEKLKVSDGMSAWIKDFQASDAPQFKGKSDKERRDMAIAAFMSAKKESTNEGYKMLSDYTSNKKDISESVDTVIAKISKIKSKSAEEIANGLSPVELKDITRNSAEYLKKAKEKGIKGYTEILRYAKEIQG